MMKYMMILVAVLLSFMARGSGRDSTVTYLLPDSVKAVQYMAEITVINLNPSRLFQAGIQTDASAVYLSEYKGKRSVTFFGTEYGKTVVLGLGVKDVRKGRLIFDFGWETGKTYKLMLAMTSDTAEKICIYSGYIFLPDENRWKLIGTRTNPFWKDRIQKPAAFLSAHKKSTGNMIIGGVWCQRNNGSWRNMKESDNTPPAINYIGHADSVQQRLTEIRQIEEAIASGKTDVKENINGVYYHIMKEGTGRQVSLNDTVVVHYKGYLFSDGSVFDQTKEKPATFPLNRLIRGWQLGVPLCKVGGKIKLVIPSDLAYSIRTRAAKIPPNSILVFEVEVVDVKSP